MNNTFKDTNFRIKVVDGVKSYGRQLVLNSINLTAYKSTIYGLLGASGCGKTTLLSCLLGLSKLDSGIISLNGIHCRKDIGYMPQEISLFQDFTIQEICLFYGKLYGIKEKDTLKKADQLVDMFDLTCTARPIKSLSGGEQRRVSLAVTVLHDPKVLILDEPTVGMDCLLGERLWKYFLSLKAQGTCIILSTHYFQEATLCNQVGFMRNGVILAEECPEQLMAMFNSPSLEDVLLQLSIDQEKHLTQTDQPRQKVEKKIGPSNQDLFPEEKVFSLERMYAQLSKNINWHTKHYLGTAALMVYPLWIAVIYGLVTGSLNTKNYSVGLINEEFSNQQLSYQHYCLNPNQSYSLQDFNLTCSIPNQLSCIFVHSLSNEFNIIYFDNWDLARLSLLKNKVSAIIYIQRNFTDGIMGRIEYGLSAPEDFVNSSYMHVSLDNSDFIMYNILITQLRDLWLDFFVEVLKKCGLSEKNVPLPIKMENPVYGSPNSSFSESSVPGFLCGFSAFYPMIYTVSVIMTEKVQGLLTRNFAAGMRYSEVAVAHTLVQTAIMVVQNISVLFVFFQIFKYSLVNHAGYILIVQVLCNIFGVTLGFATIELFNNELFATYFCVGATVIVFHVSGIIWPQEGFHKSLNFLEWIFPSVSSSQTFISLISHNYSLSNLHLLRGILVNVYISCLLVLASIFLYWRNSKTR
ncbi:ABC transporter G family member 23-like [Rhodnius prolixus]|uniref:ABC transporter G family member 23-like n=1 Tax=Rhodnius prolixus TaxID=13249 RepID=UPI003D18A5CD